VAESSAIDPNVAYESALRLLALADPPSAVFAVNNVAVVGVVEARERRVSRFLVTSRASASTKSNTRASTPS
jgi:DNA-binding LacI/PurR family transcriptional regulator